MVVVVPDQPHGDVVGQRDVDVALEFAAARTAVLSLAQIADQLTEPLSLGDLPVGHWREATPREISALRRVGQEARADLDARAAG